ncbi:MAG: hypothetical protein GY788_01855 [bacterium]|nr:hypothetical protein [bacterium]
MKRVEAKTIAGIFVALIGIPLIVFAAGTRPEPNQNRPPTPLPELTVEGIADRSLTPQVDAYLEDALIIAPGAVAAQAWTDVALGDNPSEEVTLGDSGWLYYTFSLTRPCLAPADTEAFTDTVARAEAVVAATDRQLIVALAPDKATIIPEYLPADETCVHQVADALNALEGPPTLLTVWDEMRKARANERPVYFRLDSHWTNEGAGVMAKAIVERLVIDGWNEQAVHEVATVEHEGDLTLLLGLPSTESVVELETVLPESDPTEAVRTLLTANGTEYDKVVAVDFTSGGDPVIAGQTLVMHDSYGWAVTPMLAPYFESAAFIAETNPSAGHMAADLIGAETIVHLSVQRSLHEIILDVDLAASFVAAYADEFDAIDQGTNKTGERLELEPGDTDTYVVVEMAPGTDGAEVAYNDVTMVLTPDSPRAAFYVGPGGTMFFAGVVDYRLIAIGG